MTPVARADRVNPDSRAPEFPGIARAVILRAVALVGEKIQEELTIRIGYWLAQGYLPADFQDAFYECTKPAILAAINYPNDFLPIFAGYVQQAADRRRAAEFRLQPARPTETERLAGLQILNTKRNIGHDTEKHLD